MLENTNVGYKESSMRIMKRYSESIESERELRKFVERLLPIFGENIYFGIQQYNEHPIYGSDVGITQFYLSNLRTSLSQIYPSKFLSSFYDWMLENNFQIKIGYNEGKFKAQFRNNDYQIFITFLKPLMLDLIDIVKRVSNEKIAITKVTNLLGKDYFHEVLLHEMTHAYDHFISQGKYFNNKSYVPAAQGDISSVDYYAQDIEINAFYSGFIKSLEEQGWKYVYADFEDLFERFRGMKGHYRVIDWMKDFPIEKKQKITSRLYQWFIDPPKGKIEERKALELYYTYLTSKVLGSALLDDFSDFTESTLTRFFERSIKEYLPPSLKRLATSEGAVQYLLETMILFAKGKYRPQEVKTPYSLQYEGFGSRFYVLTRLASFFEINYFEFQWEIDDPNWQGDRSNAYQSCFGFIEFLSLYAKYSYKDFLRLDKEFPHKIPVTHLIVNTKFKELLMKNGR